MLDEKQQQKCIDAMGYFDGVTNGYSNEIRAALLCEYTNAVIGMTKNGCFCPMSAMVAAAMVLGLNTK